MCHHSDPAHPGVARRPSFEIGFGRLGGTRSFDRGELCTHGCHATGEPPSRSLLASSPLRRHDQDEWRRRRSDFEYGSALPASLRVGGRFVSGVPDPLGPCEAQAWDQFHRAMPSKLAERRGPLVSYARIKTKLSEPLIHSYSELEAF